MSYQILKSCVKDIIDQNQGISQEHLIKMFTPIQLVCNLYTINLSNLSMSELSIQSSFSNTATTSTIGQKILVDILIMLWETYFCKHLVIYRAFIFLLN